MGNTPSELASSIKTNNHCIGQFFDCLTTCTSCWNLTPIHHSPRWNRLCLNRVIRYIGNLWLDSSAGCPIKPAIVSTASSESRSSASPRLARRQLPFEKLQPSPLHSRVNHRFSLCHGSDLSLMSWLPMFVCLATERSLSPAPLHCGEPGQRQSRRRRRPAGGLATLT